jgi:antitoxin (DNA-binding transcriptional repressor) of toxin-antitoxin stability system
MKTISAREANQFFSKLLAEAEAGEEIVITRRGRPVATLRAHDPARDDPEREAAVQRMITMMRNGMALDSHRVRRDEIYEERLGKWSGSTPTS